MELAGSEVRSPPPSLVENIKSILGKLIKLQHTQSLANTFDNAVLPRASNGGYLPYWLAFVAVVSVYNTIQAFVSPTLTKRLYSRKPEEGECTIASTIVRQVYRS